MNLSDTNIPPILAIEFKNETNVELPEIIEGFIGSTMTIPIVTYKFNIYWETEFIVISTLKSWRIV